MATNHNWLNNHLPTAQMQQEMAVINDEIAHLRSAAGKDLKLSIKLVAGALALAAVTVFVMYHIDMFWLHLICIAATLLVFLSGCEVLAVAFNKSQMISEMKRLAAALRTEEAERIARDWFAA